MLPRWGCPADGLGKPTPDSTSVGFFPPGHLVWVLLHPICFLPGLTFGRGCPVLGALAIGFVFL